MLAGYRGSGGRAAPDLADGHQRGLQGPDGGGGGRGQVIDGPGHQDAAHPVCTGNDQVKLGAARLIHERAAAWCP